MCVDSPQLQAVNVDGGGKFSPTQNLQIPKTFQKPTGMHIVDPGILFIPCIKLILNYFELFALFI